MKLFLDSSVVLAACGRETGASRHLFDAAPAHGWVLQSSSYVTSEVEANVLALSPAAAVGWPALRTRLDIVPDIVSPSRSDGVADRLVVFNVGTQLPRDPQVMKGLMFRRSIDGNPDMPDALDDTRGAPPHIDQGQIVGALP